MSEVPVPAGRHRLFALRIAADVLIVVVTLWLAGLIWFAESFPAPGSAPDGKTDAIVVVTGGSGRLDEGLSLLSRKQGRKLFVSGVYRGVDVAALLKMARREPQEMACCIVLGYAADNTAGNARETAEWMSSEGYASLRLVTASYHMPRSLLEFRRHMPGVDIVPHPVFPARFKQSQWWRWPGSASLIASEYNKYLLVLVRSSVVPPPDNGQAAGRAIGSANGR